MVDHKTVSIAASSQDAKEADIIFISNENDVVALSRRFPRSSILPIFNDYLSIVALLKPVEPVEQLCITPEMIMWMTWAVEPIPYELACKVHSRAQSKDELLQLQPNDDLPSELVETIKAFTLADRYINH